MDLASKIHKAELLMMLEAKDVRLCVSSFRHFVEAAFHVLEPSRKFIPNWHIDVVCDHLQAVTRGEIKRLALNFPYRSMKSVTVSQMWPVWTWLQEQKEELITAGPSTRFFTLSNAQDLATRDALNSRALIESTWFQARWGSRFVLNQDQNAKDYYENSARGYRLARGMLSTATGRDGDILLFDDPHDAVQAMYSELDRKRVLDAYDQKLANRLTDPQRAAKVLVMQRLHPDDLTGHVLKQEDWVHVVLPMEYEPARSFHSAWGYDPRTEPGELFWPERFPAATVTSEKRRLGTFGTKAQLQQEPVPIGGTILNMEWFKRYKTPPAKFDMVVAFWDTAQKEKEINDPWACGVWGRVGQDLYLLYVYNKRMNYPTGKRMVQSITEQWKPVATVIEDKSTGSSLIQELSSQLTILPFEPEGDKLTRMSVESPTIEAGLVHLPEVAAWLPDYEGEVSLFPASATKDQVDMTSMALRWFREHSTFLQATAFDVPDLARTSPWGIG
jgi:predicted phage terminase large subunit-like protein